MTKAFEVGKSYSFRWICDADQISHCEVVGRTAKTVTLRYLGKVVRRGVKVSADGIEFCHPTGRYSMAPTLWAAR